MPAIEALLVGKTAVQSDSVRSSSNTHFASFLVDELTNRLSDVADPGKDLPRPTHDDRAATPGYAPTRNDQVGSHSRHHYREDHYDGTKSLHETSRVAPSTEDRNDTEAYMARDPNNSKHARDATEAVSHWEQKTVAHSEEPPQPTAGEEQSAQGEKTVGNDATDLKQTSATTHNGLVKEATESGKTATPVAGPDRAQTVQPSTIPTKGTIAPVETRTPAETPSEKLGPPPQAAAPLRATTNQLTSQPQHIEDMPASTNVSGAVSNKGQVQPTSSGTTNIPLAAGGTTENAAEAALSSTKVKTTGTPISNDTSPQKAGSEVPLIVRDLQSIISRPANATGSNLFHAQSQGAAPSASAQTSSPLGGIPQPTSQHVGQSGQLHVGATPGGGSGHPGDQSTGQQSNGQAKNSNSSNPAASMNQAASSSPDSSQGSAQIQNTQVFHQAFAKANGSNAAQSTALSGADASTSNRFEGPSTPLSSPQRLPSSSQADRAAPALQHNRPMPSPAVNQVSVRVAKAVASGESHMRIQLRPEELGRVEVKLDIANDGRAKALVMAERPETLELLQRDSRVLERALQDAGLKTDQNSLSFNLHGRERQELNQFAEQGSKSGTGSGGDTDLQDDDFPAETPIPATAIGLAQDGSVNFLA